MCVGGTCLLGKGFQWVRGNDQAAQNGGHNLGDINALYTAFHLIFFWASLHTTVLLVIWCPIPWASCKTPSFSMASPLEDTKKSTFPTSLSVSTHLSSKICCNLYSALNSLCRFIPFTNALVGLCEVAEIQLWAQSAMYSQKSWADSRWFIYKGDQFWCLDLKIILWGFLGGSVVKSPSANAGNWSLIPALWRSHKPWSNSACVPRPLSLCPRAWEPQLLSVSATTSEACMPRAHALQQEKTLQWGVCTSQPESSSCEPQLEKKPAK